MGLRCLLFGHKYKVIDSKFNDFSWWLIGDVECKRCGHRTKYEAKVKW
ncbi:hypothetical protein ITR00_06240 [Pediococcus pentosaceus]|jgi:hypothetical protein|nr:DUF1660 family phage protein [Pediococcus pentosaceus]MBF7125659.1 hypothetical protein [Pediococcus pentosaceus]WPK17289.1 DUF1660 family phage protein [Pediococcus pentosaceus]